MTGVRRWLNVQDFERREWATVGAVAIALVVLNKVIVQDHGSDWLTLVVLSLFAGVAVVNASIYRRIRRLKRREQPQAP